MAVSAPNTIAVCVCLWIVCLNSSITSAQNPESTKKNSVSSSNKRKQDEFFESRIRPVLVEHCYECHSNDANENKGGLLLDSSLALRKGGDTGPAIVPGNAQASLLLKAIEYDDLEMPPDGKLNDRIISDFKKWIDAGAHDPRTGSSGSRSAAKSNQAQKASELWSLKPPKRQQLPEIQNQSWPKNRIDYFVLARLEAEKLTPSPRATIDTLNRRLHYDLTGLPPDKIEQDVALLIDSLMGSPRFGEKWARLWLDIARYAEDQAHIVGNNQSLFYPNAYLFRDWVIESFNRDLPYDEFVRQQIAIDLMPRQDGEVLEDQDLAALGFLGLGPKYYRRNDLSVMADEWEDRVDTVSRGLLGLTVACARCHDHKYDPITTEDYYALAGVFASTEMYNKPIADNAKVKDKDPKADKQKKNSPSESLHIVRDRKPKNLNVFIRGDTTSKGDIVERRFLTAMNPEGKKFDLNNSGRLDLANAITSPGNPLFARVIVNRVWLELMGNPLVGTPSNFGALGERPSHPKLLDDLARRFQDNGWSIKWLIREIVSSNTYLQSSKSSDDSQQLDPANVMLSRMNRKRLSIEQWRDAILKSNESLTSQLGGKSIQPSDFKQTRRTIYSQVSRFQLDNMLALFDFPDPNAHSAKRSDTISPLQKMFALNSEFLLKHSEKLKVELERDPSSSATDSFVQAAYRRLFQRDPTSEELAVARKYLPRETGNPAGDRPVVSRVAFLQTLLISNEFTFVD